MKMVFVRNWWRKNPKWPNGLEPDGNARKTVIARNLTEAEARQMCEEYNRTHAAGKLGRKAEYQEQ